jgi:hypothetical protein
MTRGHATATEGTADRLPIRRFDVVHGTQSRERIAMLELATPLFQIY